VRSLYYSQIDASTSLLLLAEDTGAFARKRQTRLMG